MNGFMFVLNFIMTFVCWGWATQAFEEERTKSGFWFLFWSAWSAACVADMLTS